ncbi:MAG: hypothetical protein ACOX5G_06015 [Kiritimatiellia bacterium]|jgi:hypothetical protein
MEEIAMQSKNEQTIMCLTAAVGALFLVPGCLAKQKSSVAVEQHRQSICLNKKTTNWFLDPSLIYSALVVRNSADTNGCIAAFTYDMSIGAPYAHWIVYKPQEIVIMVEMTLGVMEALPEGRMGEMTLLSVPNSMNRRIVFSDTLTNKDIAADFNYTEKDIPKCLQSNTEPLSEDDPFQKHSGKNSSDTAADIWPTD